MDLGSKVKDRITGFTGTVTGVAKYLTGCHQACVVPPLAADGAFREAQWFDLQRLEITEGEVVTLDNGASPGCDMPPPPAR